MTHHEGSVTLGALFADMFLEGIECRAYQDETGIEILWRPKPKQMSPQLWARIKEHAADLACILAPNEPGKVRPARPFWTAGSLSQCFGCGKATILTDPLGQPRHDWCGWLGGRLQKA